MCLAENKLLLHNLNMVLMIMALYMPCRLMASGLLSRTITYFCLYRLNCMPAGSCIPLSPDIFMPVVLFNLNM